MDVWFGDLGRYTDGQRQTQQNRLQSVCRHTEQQTERHNITVRISYSFEYIPPCLVYSVRWFFSFARTFHHAWHRFAWEQRHKNRRKCWNGVKCSAFPRSIIPSTYLPHQCRIYASVKLLNINSRNGLSPVRCQAITRTNAGCLSSGLLWTNTSEIELKVKHFHWALQWRHNELDGVSNHQHHNCLLNRLFRHRSKKISKLRVTGLCVGNSPVIGEFPAHKASNAENVSIW